MKAILPVPFRNASTGKPRGYVIIILMIAVFAISIGMLIAVPVWRTELQRDKEDELIFRGRQYVEAVRLYLIKHPAKYPASLDELIEEKCLRRLYRDPLTKRGDWLIILAPPSSPTSGAGKFSEVTIVPENALDSVKLPRILGVMSPSKDRSIRIYNDQDSYDKWLFFYGQDPKKLPKITYLEED
jgi:type II secretory pathway pseudopilin PulG